jgi:hypothetical protein
VRIEGLLTLSAPRLAKAITETEAKKLAILNLVVWHKAVSKTVHTKLV